MSAQQPSSTSKATSLPTASEQSGLDLSGGGELSCFDILNVLRSRMYIARTKLMEHIVVAQKDKGGEISWVEFNAPFHSHLVKCTLALFHKPDNAVIAMAKRAMFVYFLELLNREDANSFFDLQRGKTRDARAQQEKKRLARKRARAAKRERVREAAKRVDDQTSTRVSNGTKCDQCGRLFNSRKRFSKHACVTKEAELVKTSRRLERRERRRAAKAAHAAPVPAAESPKPEQPPTTTNSATSPPVTGSSGEQANTIRPIGKGHRLLLPADVLDCENCSNTAAVLKHDRWPKCLDCIPFYLPLGGEDPMGVYSWVEEVAEAVRALDDD